MILFPLDIHLEVGLPNHVEVLFLISWVNSILYVIVAVTVYIPTISSVQFSHSVVSDSLQPRGLQHARLPCPSPTPGSCSNSCLLSWWCHPAISSTVIPFFSCLESFPASGPFPMSQFFASGGQSIRVSVSASILPVNIQDWFPSGLTGLMLFQFKGLSRVFSNTRVHSTKIQLHSV